MTDQELLGMDMDRDSFELRWPQDGDRLFVESTWSLDAYIVRDPGERFYRMSLGYKRSGDLLVDQACTDLVDRGNVIYAALFCYRQSIELFLKWIIEDFGDDETEVPVTQSHRLDDLWRTFLGIADRCSTLEAEGLREAEALVNEMHWADRASDAFRYPYSKKGRLFNFGDRGIDLNNLRVVMQGLANFFDCTHTSFLETERARADSLAEQM